MVSHAMFDVLLRGTIRHQYTTHAATNCTLVLSAHSPWQEAKWVGYGMSMVPSKDT